MREFASWTNLAETTFLFPPTEPGADYKVRIFTPTREMLFAGHPTLGSCAAWLHSGGRAADTSIVRQECAIGIVEIDISDETNLAFAAPPTKVRPMQQDNFERITERLGIAHEEILYSAELENGPVWQAMHLRSAEAVMAAQGRALNF